MAVSDNLTREKRDLVLPPGSYAYMQDVTKGVIKTYTGPTVINPTAQEKPVVYNAETGEFEQLDILEDAVRQAPVAVEGFYITLLNPAKGNVHPNDGTAQPSADLDVGRKIIIPGPAMFSLWPGQAAEVVRGHHLRSNQYLLCRVYNEDEARKNWSKAVVKPAEKTPELGTDGQPVAPAVTTAAPISMPTPSDLTVGKLLIIRGTEVSFYIPPTGITVVADGKELVSNKSRYVRDALTLEQLEYCILTNENGKKRYEKGPQVVFPTPSERFIEAKDGSGTLRKFRAIELNSIQGIYVKVIAPYEENGKKYNVGDELFITGKDTDTGKGTAIYFPREEHSAITYDGKVKHFATAVPAGEARYVMNRLTGEIATAVGPAMLLPDPRTTVIVRRVLTDSQVSLWYPGNTEALAYNQGLRKMLSNVPTTRSGAISEGDFSRGSGAPNKLTMDFMEMSTSNASLIAETFDRSASYSQPRTVTLDTKYQGAVALAVWTGYAVLVVSKTGKRRVVTGPATVLLDYDESLEHLELSTGKPKNTDKLLQTAYLRVDNNKVSDIITVETADHVMATLSLSYRVNFRGDPMKWFAVENYVKFLCDHVRSVLRGQIRKLKIEEFYSKSTELIRDYILGDKTESGKRLGMAFAENGMQVDDVEVLKVFLTDDWIRNLLEKAQHDVVSTNITLSTLARNLETVKTTETFAREEAETRAATKKQLSTISIDVAAAELAVILAKLAGQVTEAEEKQTVEKSFQAIEDLKFNARLARENKDKSQAITFAQQEMDQKIVFARAEAEAIVTRFGAVEGGFTEALLALSNNETLVKVAEAWNLTRAIGGDSVSDALAKVFTNTPLKPLLEKLTGVAAKPNGAQPRA